MLIVREYVYLHTSTNILDVGVTTMYIIIYLFIIKL